METLVTKANETVYIVNPCERPPDEFFAAVEDEAAFVLFSEETNKWYLLPNLSSDEQAMVRAVYNSEEKDIELKKGLSGSWEWIGAESAEDEDTTEGLRIIDAIDNEWEVVESITEEWFYALVDRAQNMVPLSQNNRPLNIELVRDDCD